MISIFSLFCGLNLLQVGEAVARRFATPDGSLDVLPSRHETHPQTFAARVAFESFGGIGFRYWHG